MNNYYTIQLTGGTSPGPYTVYYNILGSSGNIPNIYQQNVPAVNLPLSAISTGFVVIVPDNTTDIYIYNQLCDTHQVFNVTPTPVNYGCLCVTISSGKYELYESKTACYSGVFVNGKPKYSGDTFTIEWNDNGGTNGYWEMIGYTVDNNVFRSTDNDFIPDTNWYAFGSFAYLFTLFSQSGECNQYGRLIGQSLNISIDNPTCVGYNDGTIHVTGIGGSGWTYSLDGIIYQNYNGVFTGLQDGLYVVYGKDSENNIVSTSVTLSSTPIFNFNVIPVTNLTMLPNVGNMIYYLLDVTYNTTTIPLGESISFDYSLVYNLNYKEPGTVQFDTIQSYILHNGNFIGLIQTESTPLSPISPLPCNPTLYNLYSGSISYTSNQNITLVNGDTLEVKIVYGINTQTNGTNLNGCITEANVNITAMFENIVNTCQCCQFVGSIINNNGTSQIYNS